MIAFTQALDDTGPEMLAAENGQVSDANRGRAAQEYRRLSAISRHGTRMTCGRVTVVADGLDLVLKLPGLSRDAARRRCPVVLLARREEILAEDFMDRVRSDAAMLDRELDEPSIASDLAELIAELAQQEGRHSWVKHNWVVGFIHWLLERFKGSADNHVSGQATRR
jgi:hypothetical protein